MKSNFKDLQKKLLSTKGLIWMVSLFFLFIIILTVFQSCSPRKGNILYGLCGEFLELQLPFPETLQYTQVSFYPRGTRISYTHIDGFGEYQLETIECSFYQDPEAGVQLENVYFNYVKDVTEKTRTAEKGRLYSVQKKYIDLFNRSLSASAMVSGELDLTIPDHVWIE